MKKIAFSTFAPGCLGLVLSLLSFVAVAEVKALAIVTKSICTSVEIKWTPLNGGVKYLLYYRPYPGDNTWLHRDFSATEQSFAIDLWDGAAFEIRMLVLDARNTIIAVSAYKKIFTGDYLLAPLFSTSIADTRATLTWNAVPTATQYQIRYVGNGINGNWPIDVNTTSVTLDIPENTYFSAGLVALDQRGVESEYSTIRELFVGTQPDSSAIFQNTVNFKNPLQVTPAEPSSSYASKLQDCLYSATRSKPCTLNELPLLGQETAQPSVDDIMARVLTTDAWMAKRMREVLQSLPPAMLPLFRAITGIVIADDIKPANYRRDTGALYLEPLYLWRTAAEKQTLSQHDDPRKDCATQLRYSSFFDYTIQGEWVFADVAATERPLSRIVYLNAAVLLHELTHANDQFPPARLQQLPRHLNLREAGLLNLPWTVANQVQQRFPLQSQTLRYLAEHKFFCKSATCTQIATTAEEVEREISAELVNSDYNFVSVQEDVAMLAEELMLRYFFQAERLSFISDKAVKQERKAYWIRKGQIGAPQLKAKVAFILKLIYPELPLDSFLEQLPPPEVTPSGTPVCQLLSCQPVAKTKSLDSSGLLPYQ